MTDLSPQAQAVLVAATPALNSFDACGFNNQHYDRKAIAAALRAAAEELLPPEIDLPPAAPDAGHLRQHERRLIRRDLLNIAQEVENHQ